MPAFTDFLLNTVYARSGIYVRLVNNQTGGTYDLGRSGAQGQITPDVPSGIYTVSTSPDNITYTVVDTGYIVSYATAAVFQQAIIERCITSNRATASGNLTFDYVYPGADFRPGGVGGVTDSQFLHDSCWLSAAAASLGLGLVAQNWLKNWPGSQLSGGTTTNGMMGRAISPTTVYNKSSQVPVLAWATYQVWLKTQDNAFLAYMYPALKREYTWWSLNRADTTSTYGLPSNLYSWGCTVAMGGGTQSAADLLAATFEAAQEAGMDNLETLYGPTGDVDNLGPQCDTNPGKLNYCCPDLCSYIVLMLDSISKIAAIVAPGEAAGYATLRDNLKTTMNLVMWDDEQGLYQYTTRQDVLSVGNAVNTNGVTNQYSPTVNLKAPGLDRNLAPGTKVIFGNGVVAQIGPAGQRTGDTVLNLLAGVASSIPDNEFSIFRFFYYGKNLANIAGPLFAGVPSAYRAQRMVQEQLLKEYTGADRQDYEMWFGSGFPNNRLLRFNHVEWLGPQKTFAADLNPGAITVNIDGVTINGGGTQTQLSLSNPSRSFNVLRYRDDLDTNNDFLFYRGPWELSSPARPFTISPTYIVPTGGGPNVKISTQTAYGIQPSINGPGATAPIDTVFTGGVAGTTRTDTTVGITDGGFPHAVWLYQPAGATGALKLLKLVASSYPQGFVFASPNGLIISPRMGKRTWVRPETDDSHQGGSEGNQPDYQKGSHWVFLEYQAIQGLLNYNMNQAAQDIAFRVIRRVYNEWLSTGKLKEYYSMRGHGMGSDDYEWTALVAPLVDRFGMPVVT